MTQTTTPGAPHLVAGPTPLGPVSAGHAGLPRILGTTPLVRVASLVAYFLTALSYLRVLQRLLVPGISVEDTTTWTAAFRIILEGDGARLYDPNRQVDSLSRWIQLGSADHAPLWAFPPPHSFILAPFGYVSPFALYVLLTFVSAAVWLLLVRSSVAWLRTRPQPWSDNAVALAAAGAVAFTPAMGAIRYGAFSVLVVACLWAGIRRTLDQPSVGHEMSTRRSSSSTLATAALWFAAALKPQMVVLSMLAVTRRRFGAVMGAGIALVGSSLALAAVFGTSLLRGWIDINLVYSKKSPGAPIDRMWTLRGVLTRAFGDTPTVTTIWMIGTAIAFLLTISLGWGAKHPARLGTAIATALALQCVLFPYQSSYDTVLLVPAVLLSLDTGRHIAPRLTRVFATFALVGTLTVFSPRWEENLPGLGWRFPLPALLVWACSAMIVWIAIATWLRERSALPLTSEPR